MKPADVENAQVVSTDRNTAILHRKATCIEKESLVVVVVVVEEEEEETMVREGCSTRSTADALDLFLLLCAMTAMALARQIAFGFFVFDFIVVVQDVRSVYFLLTPPA